MKKTILKFVIPAALIFLTLSYSCKKLLNQPVVNSLSPNVLATKAGVDGLLIGAYATLLMNPDVTVGLKVDFKRLEFNDHLIRDVVEGERTEIGLPSLGADRSELRTADRYEIVSLWILVGECFQQRM